MIIQQFLLLPSSKCDGPAASLNYIVKKLIKHITFWMWMLIPDIFEMVIWEQQNKSSQRNLKFPLEHNWAF